MLDQEQIDNWHRKRIDHMLAYSAGPAKLARFDAGELVEAADRWRSLVGGMVHLSLATIERAIQNKIDEEGCGAFFAAAKYVTHPDTMSSDTCGARHGDVNGDPVGDGVTFPDPVNKGLPKGAVDLGSGDESRGGSNPLTRTKPFQSNNYLK